MTQDFRLGLRWSVSLCVSCALAACAASSGQTPRSGAAQDGAAPSGEFAEVGSFADHGVPKGVVVWLRVPAAGRDIPLLGTLMGLGSMLDPSEVLANKLGASLSRAVDLSRPMDMTVSGIDDGPVRLALVAGIANLNVFLEQIRTDFRVVHQARGRWRIVPQQKPAPDTLGCELWHAPKPVGARLVCATSPELIEAQGEFFMAAARTSVDRANFHAELPGAAAQFALKKGAEEEDRKQAGIKEDPGDSAARAMGRKFVTDFARDLSGISWDLTLQRDSVEISQVIGFSQAESLLSTSLSGRVGSPKPVPEAYWHLPSDSDLSLYSEGAEPGPMRRLVASGIQTLMAAAAADNEFEVPAAVMDQMGQIMGSLLLRGGAFELAYGQDLDRAERALSEAAEHAADRGPRSGSADPALKKAQAQLGGWAVLGLEDDSHAYLQALREALRLAADKTKYPRKKGAKATPPSPSKHSFRELPLSPAAGLPAAALHLVVRSEPNPKYVAAKGKEPALPPSAYHVIAVPDAAQHVWLAISSDEAVALARMRAVLTPDPEKTLGKSAELKQLAKQPLAGIGFATFAGVSGLSLSAESKAKVLESRETLKNLWALPKRGATRIPIWITRAQSAKGERRIAVNLRLTPDAIGDAVATFLAQASDSGEEEEQDE